MTVRRVFGLAIVAMAIAAPQAFAVGWTQPVSITPASTVPGVQTQNLRLAVNKSGAQVISWDDWDYSPDSPICVGGEATTRVPGGTWAAPPTPTGCGSQVQIGPDGTAVVLWDKAGDASTTLEAATAPAGSTFGAAQAVVTSPGAHEQHVAALDAQGRVTVAWIEYNVGTSRYDLLAKTQNADGSWPAAAEPAQPSSSQDAAPIGLAIGPTGDAVIAWGYLGPAIGEGLSVSTRAPLAATWSTTTLLPPAMVNSAPTQPLVAFDSQDRVTVMAAFRTGPSTHDLYAWSRAADTTAWDPTVQVVPNAANTLDFPTPALAVDSAGNAQAAFVFPYSATPGEYDYSIRAATRPPGSTTWSTDVVELGPVPCTIGGRPTTPSVAFDTQDTATVALDCADGVGGRLFTRPFGSTKFTSFTGPPGSASPTIVTDPNGYLIATWSAAGITYTSVYDAVAPTIDTVTPPSGAVAGQPVAFDVAGSDVWGPVTYSVDFGDGSSPATGRAIAPRRGALARATVTNSVAHTYANPGDYTATVTVADNAANTATTSRAVSVAPAPSAAPSVTPPVLPPVTAPGLPDPIAGQTVNIAPVKVPVRVKLPGAKRFIPLTAPAQVRVGSIIDTTKGRVRITIDNGHLGFDTADFYEGLFKVLQTKAVKAFATMQLTGGSFKGCPRAPKVKIARKQLSAKRSVRHLWGAGNGAFRTVGRFSSASIRGTKWLTDDRCNGTLTRVTQGKVAVRDFVRRKTIVLKKGQRYLAKARAKR